MAGGAFRLLTDGKLNQRIGHNRLSPTEQQRRRSYSSITSHRGSIIAPRKWDVAAMETNGTKVNLGRDLAEIDLDQVVGGMGLAGFFGFGLGGWDAHSQSSSIATKMVDTAMIGTCPR